MGVFTFITESALSTGVYELQAIATDQFGAKSEWSDSVRIAVQKPGYILIGTILVSILSVFVPLAALILLFILLTVYLWRKISDTRSSVRKETKEALEILADEFSHIRKVLAIQSKEMELSRKSGKLTKAENDLVESIRETLNESEKKIRSEVDDVDDYV